MNLLEGVSKLSKLLRQGLLDTNAKIFFDIDGVLAPYEFGIFSHCIDDEEWDEMVKDNDFNEPAHVVIIDKDGNVGFEYYGIVNITEKDGQQNIIVDVRENEGE